MMEICLQYLMVAMFVATSLSPALAQEKKDEGEKKENAAPAAAQQQQKHRRRRLSSSNRRRSSLPKTCRRGWKPRARR